MMPAVSPRNRCPHCGAPLDPTQPDCPECHREVPEENLRAAELDPVQRAKRHRWPIPWGLFILLGLYFGAVVAFTHWERVTSPEFKAARHLRIAQQLLGEDDGRTADKKALLEALDSLIAAIKLKPDDTWAQQRIEVVARRLDERRAKMTPEQRQIVDALGMRYRAAEDSKKSILVVGVRDIWDIDSLADMPGRVARRTLLGALVIVVFWLYKTMQDRKHMARLELERQGERRRDLRELARPKRRVSGKS